VGISSLPYPLFGFLVLGICGRARTSIIIHLLLSFFVCVMPANEASRPGTDGSVIAGVVARYTADDRPF